MLMLLVWGQHFENHRSRALGTVLKGHSFVSEEIAVGQDKGAVHQD